MKKFFLFITLLSALSANSQPFMNDVASAQSDFDYSRDFKKILERTLDKNDSLFYPKLLIRFLDNDPTLTRSETLALMIGFTENNHYKPDEDMETEKEIIELNDNGYYEDALDESKKYLTQHPLSLSILKERSFAYHQLGIRDSAKYFMSLCDKIMEAMIYSGHGKGSSPEIAFFSLGLNDGDYFIPNVGMSVAGKKTQTDKSRRLMYVINAMNDEGVYKYYYFMIQHAKMKILGNELLAKKNSKLKAAQAKAKAKKGKKGKKDAGNQALKDSTGVEIPMDADSASIEITKPGKDKNVHPDNWGSKKNKKDKKEAKTKKENAANISEDNESQSPPAVEPNSILPENPEGDPDQRRNNKSTTSDTIIDNPPSTDEEQKATEEPKATPPVEINQETEKQIVPEIPSANPAIDNPPSTDEEHKTTEEPKAISPNPKETEEPNSDRNNLEPSSSDSSQPTPPFNNEEVSPQSVKPVKSEKTKKQKPSKKTSVIKKNNDNE